MTQLLAPGSIDRYNELVKRLISSKGEPLEGIAPELLADITIEQAPALAYEFYFLAATTRYSSGEQATATPGVGNFSVVELRNPTGSGVLQTIEAIIMLNRLASATTYNLGIDQQAPGGGVGFGTPLDTREPTGKKSSGQLRISTTLVAAAVTDGNAIDTVTLVANEENTPFQLAPGIVVSPGHALQVGALLAQFATAVLFLWRERPLAASELVRA
jgi:hypothetical protein